MELQEALNSAKGNFRNNINEDSILYNNIMMKLFGLPYKWSEEFLKHFEASLASADTEGGCTPGTPGCVREEGYIPKELLLSLFRCMLEIYARKSNKQYADFALRELYNEIIILYNLIQLINHSQNNTKDNHISLMKDFVIQSVHKNKQVCYHAGFPGHSIYINYFGNSGKLYALICNLGAGLDRHETQTLSDETTLVYPVLLEIINIDHHLTCIYDADNFKGSCSDDQKQGLIDDIYSSGITTKFSYSAEIAQRTGNCVVKNYMHAMACRMMNNHHDYLDIFKCIRSILGSHLAQEYGIRDVAHLHRSLAESQTSFTGASCKDLQDFPLHTPIPETRTVNHPSAIDPTIARVSGAMLGAGTGMLLSYQLLKNKDLSEGEKFIIILTTGVIGCIIGERLGDAISQPSTSQETVYRDAEVPARCFTTCNPSI